jgi:hypothetical protein
MSNTGLTVPPYEVDAFFKAFHRLGPTVWSVQRVRASGCRSCSRWPRLMVEPSMLLRARTAGWWSRRAACRSGVIRFV